MVISIFLVYSRLFQSNLTGAPSASQGQNGMERLGARAINSSLVDSFQLKEISFVFIPVINSPCSDSETNRKRGILFVARPLG